MESSNNPSSPHVNNWQSRLILFLRYLGGGVVGLIFGLILFILSETINPPLLGPIIAGQMELFEIIFFYTLYDQFQSFELLENLSFIMYFSLWGTIGALIASNRKHQVRIGGFLLFLYLIMGCLFYIIWLFITIPT